MGNAPVAKYVEEDRKTLKIVAWETRGGGVSYTIEKSNKNKEGDWQVAKLNYLWREDIEALAKLAKRIIAESDGAPPTSSVTPTETTIDDDDIDF